MDSYRVTTAPVRHEIDKIKGSRFLAVAAPIRGQTDATDLVESLRRECHDARHVAFAWRLGQDGARFRSSDDGEPSGSAGRPILRELDALELTNTVVCVVRWFGGTKLGVGGLVRAYGGAARAVLARTLVREVQVTRTLRVRHPWECSGAVSAVLAAHELTAQDAEYEAEVSFTLEVPRAQAEAVERELLERTAALAVVERPGDEQA